MMQEQSPLGTIVQMHRQSVETGQRMARGGVRARRAAWSAARENLSAGEEVGRSGLDASEAMVMAALDATDRAAPWTRPGVGTARSLTADWFDTVEAVQADGWELLDQLFQDVEATTETMDDETLAAFDDAVEAYLDGLETVSGAVESGAGD